jgi:hypothetical protein
MAKKSAKSILKSKGLIPKEWNLRHLTGGQKSWITKQAKKYAAVIENPSKFESRVYGKAKAAKLKEAGYFGEGNHILIPNFGDKTARTRVSEDTVTITRVDSKGRAVIEKVYLHSGPELLKRLQKQFSKPLGKGEYWSLKVGDNNTFLEAGEKTLSELMRYGSRISFQGNGDAKEWAVHHVHLVKFKFEDGEDHLRERQLPYNPSNPADPSNYKGRKKWQNKRGK